MKTILFFIAFVAFAGFACFAQQAGVSVAKPNQISAIHKKTVVGKIENFTPEDTSKGVKAGLVVIEANGNKITFVLTSTTVIYDLEKSVAGADKLVKNQEIQVKYYAPPSGINEAIELLLLKTG